MRPVSGGTDTHLALIDLRGVGVTGTDAEARCDAARITLNKNAIPYDPQPPMIASGIRVGTPAVTTQGMTEGDAKEIAALIGRAVRDAGRRRPTSPRAWTRSSRPPGVPPRLIFRDARVRAGLLHRRGGDLPAHAGGAGGGPALGGGRRARATGTCTRSRPRGSAGWRCSSAWRWRCSSRISCRCCAGRSTPARRPPRCSSPAAIICLLGVVDDRWELDALTKLAGQVLAAGVMALLGVQLLVLYVPFGGVGTLSFARNDSVGLTVVICLLTVNAINFIDGLDGLAAGVSAIAALAFFAYSYLLARQRVRRRRARPRCSRPCWPASASASCRTTSSRPGSSWATPARC